MNESKEKRARERQDWLKSLGGVEPTVEPGDANLKLSEKQKKLFSDDAKAGSEGQDLKDPDILGELKNWNEKPKHKAMIAGAKSPAPELSDPLYNPLAGSN